jgi:hypothetical protein
MFDDYITVVCHSVLVISIYAEVILSNDVRRAASVAESPQLFHMRPLSQKVRVDCKKSDTTVTKRTNSNNHPIGQACKTAKTAFLRDGKLCPERWSLLFV